MVCHAVRRGLGPMCGWMGNGDGVGPLSRSAYIKSHSYLLVNNLHRAHKTIGRGERERKDAFCWSRGSREGCEELASGNRLRTASQGDNSFCIRGYLLVINDLYHSLHVNLAIEAQHNAS